MLIGLLREPLVEPAIPACGCLDCRYPSRENAPKRATHAIRHAAFVEWLMAHPRDPDDPSDEGPA